MPKRKHDTDVGVHHTEPERSDDEYSQNLLKLVSSRYNDAASSDLLIQLQGEQTIHGHRLLLCLWSDVWAAALQDKRQDTLDLTIYDADTARKCLRYCYTGRIALTDDNLVQVHRFALCHHLQALQSFCETVMQSELSVKNCIAVYSYLHENNIPGLSDSREAAKEMICDDFAAVSQERSFCALSGNTLCEILALKYIEVNEDDVLRACCRWIDHNKATVKLEMQERILKLVRFSQLSPKALLEFKSHELMKQSEAVKQHYHLGVEWRMTEHAGPDREELQAQLRRKNIEVAFEPRVLKFDSQILDAAMTKSLAGMLGQSASATLLSRTQGVGSCYRASLPLLCVICDNKDDVFGACCLTETSGFLFSLTGTPPRLVKLRSVVDQNRFRGDLHFSAAFSAFRYFSTGAPLGRLDYEPRLVELYSIVLPSVAKERLQQSLWGDH